MDTGVSYTDRSIKEISERLQYIYKEADKDIQRKMDDFLQRYKAKEAKYAKQVKDGIITQEDFDAWKKGQVFQGRRWQAKKDQITNTLYHTNEIATNIVNGERLHVFSFNSNYQAYKLESGAGINFGFDLYDSGAVSNLIRNEPDLLPKPRKLKKGKDKAWNSKKITRQITQGIIQGESLDKIAKRMAEAVSVQNYKDMLTHARTAMTGAQNAGRIQRLNEAQTKGIKLHKEWMATFDERTRTAHRDLDGQKRPVTKPFEIEGYFIMYPGDPHAHPSMVYNCRCTLVGDLDDYPAEFERYDNINGVPVSEMTYNKWVASKSASGGTLEFTQVGIGKAKSVKEINDMMTASGVFKPGRVDLTGCDLDSAKAIASSYEQVFYRYPQLKGKVYPPDAHPTGMNRNTYAWCYSRSSGKVQVNPKIFDDWNKVVKEYEHDVETGWHPFGTTAESIVTHEIGHAVDGLLAREGVLGGVTSSGEFRFASLSLKNTIIKRAAKLDPEIDFAITWGKNTVISDFVSRYASKNNQEWFAECFAEYITSADPRTIAKEFGKELEKLLKKLK